MTLKTESVPTYLDEFRILKLNGVLRDMKRLTPDELIKVKKEIDRLLLIEEKNA